MVQYCVVPMCKSNAFTPDISFHKFPLDKSFKKQWICKIKRDEKRNVKISSSMRVCSRHFLPEDFITSKKGLRKILRKNAVPSLFDFTSPRKTKQRRKITWLNRSDSKNTDPCKTTRDSDASSDTSSLPSFQINADQCNIARESSSDTLSVYSSQINIEPCNDRDRGNSSDTLSALSFQVNTDPCDVTRENSSDTLSVFSFQVDNDPDCSTSVDSPAERLDKLKRENTVLKAEIEYLEERLKAMEERLGEMGKENDDLKTAIENHVCKPNEDDIFSELRNNKDLLSYYTGFDDENVYKDFLTFVNPEDQFSFCTKLKSENQVFIVLMKLRQGFDNKDLAARFSMCLKVIANIFTNWINLIYSRLGYLSIWPSRDIILPSAPEEFKTKFPTTVMILDCTELKIQCPSDMVKQSQSYSTYKSHNTLKSLVGCSPAGSIMFISQLYTGSISDKKITEMCGLYKVLEDKLKVGHVLSGDSIMVDKGFAIKEEIKNLGLELNVPPMGSELQFPPEDVEDTRKIASCRVHVERAIRKVKVFKILSGVLPIKMMPHINQIWTVCGILSNFRCITHDISDDSNIFDY